MAEHCEAPRCFKRVGEAFFWTACPRPLDPLDLIKGPGDVLRSREDYSPPNQKLPTVSSFEVESPETFEVESPEDFVSSELGFPQPIDISEEDPLKKVLHETRPKSKTRPKGKHAPEKRPYAKNKPKLPKEGYYDKNVPKQSGRHKDSSHYRPKKRPKSRPKGRSKIRPKKTSNHGPYKRSKYDQNDIAKDRYRYTLIY